MKSFNIIIDKNIYHKNDQKHSYRMHCMHDDMWPNSWQNDNSSSKFQLTIKGYPDEFLSKSSIYSGYLDLQNQNRSTHYVFVESVNGATNTDPLTVWLNGGPGCSSLLGIIIT